MRSRSLPVLRPTAILAATGLALGLLVLPGTPALADDAFIESDDYREGEEIVGVFLGDDEYAKMVEDIERGGQEFDWGWVLTPRWAETASAEAAEEEPEKKRGFFRRRGKRGPKLEQEPDELAFDLSAYDTVAIEVENFAGIMKDDELDDLRESFALAMERFGLEPATGGSADLELGVAVVDINREGGGFGLIQIDPFIELEVRLREAGSGRDLVLIRNQEHGDTPTDAALEMASQIAMFLRK